MSFSRRDFLKLSFVSAASLALSACGRPVEHGVVSQFQMPEYALPGQPLYWASCCTELRADCAVAVKTVENRAIHTIGTPGHFYSKGKVNTTVVSGLQALYHPDRLSKPLKGGKPQDSIDDLAADLGRHLKNAGKDNALWIVDRLCGTRGGLIVEAAQAAGAKIWVCDAPSSVQERRVMKALNGEAKLPFYPFEHVDFLVTFGGNFLQAGYSSVRSSWSYGQFRKSRTRTRGKMVSVSSRMSASDANADVWLGVAPGTEGWVALGVGNLLAEKGHGPWPAWAKQVSMADIEAATGLEGKTLQKMADRLHEAKSPMAVAGDGLGENGVASLYIVHALNKMLRNGRPEMFEPDLVLGSKVNTSGLFVSAEQASEMLGSSKTVWIFDANPVYLMPSLADKIKGIRNSVAFTPFENDTTAVCSTVVATRTWMEDWTDLRVSCPDGDYYGIGQPAVKPQHAGSVSATEAILMALKASGLSVKKEATTARELLRGERNEKDWEGLIVRGGVWHDDGETTYPYAANHPPTATKNPGNAPAGYSPFESLPALEVRSWPSKPGAGMVLVPYLTNMANGSLANRPWLQELPDTMTTVVWDSWVEVSESKAKELGLKRYDVVDVKVGGKSFKASVILSPAVHPDVVAMPIGRGHKNFGKWAEVGVNPLEFIDGEFQAESGEPVWLGKGVDLAKTGKSIRLTTYDQRVYNLPRHILPH